MEHVLFFPELRVSFTVQRVIFSGVYVLILPNLGVIFSEMCYFFRRIRVSFSGRRAKLIQKRRVGELSGMGKTGGRAFHPKRFPDPVTNIAGGFAVPILAPPL